MKFEKLAKPIESKSIEEHEKKLQDKMIDIQLEYVDGLFSKKIPPLSKDSGVSDIKNLISKYTEIPSRIMQFRHGDANEEKLKIAKDHILNNISDLYYNDHEHWIEKTREIINSEVEKFEKSKENKSSDENIRNRAGLIDFGIETNLGRLLPNSGLSDGDPCLQIHFHAFYKQKKDDVKNLFSSSSLEKLAVKIVDEHPEVKAVVAKSWLMDTVIAKRIGFKVYGEDFNKKLDSGFWSQFIDQNGQIKSEEVSKFLKTGKSKYKNVAGVILVEDFLRRYLPKEKRGKIVLKDIKPEISEEVKREQKLFKDLFLNWDKIDEGDINKVISECRIIKDFSKTQEGKEFINFLKSSKYKKKNIEEIRNDPLSKIYGQTLNKFVNNLLFIDREVVI